MKRVLFPLAAVLTLLSSPVLADEPAGDPAGESAAEEEMTEEEAFAQFKKEVQAIEGPYKGARLGNIATIDVPEGTWFVPKAGVARFDKLLENIYDPNSLGVLVSGVMDSAAYFTWDAIGYVKDDEKDLDADDLLDAMRENMEANNPERVRSGYDEFEMIGWVKKPFYNEKNQSLEWATAFRAKGGQGAGTSNYNTRRLGREGVMSVVLASPAESVETELAKLDERMSTFTFTAGKDYASFKEGDRLAEIGLGALVVGGGVAVLAKLGFLQKFWKILVGIGAVIFGGIAKLFGRKKKDVVSPVASQDDSGQG